MSLKFTGTFESLKIKLSSLSGEWHEDQPSKKVLRLNGGVLNWFGNTGTLQFQGRSPGLEQLQASVPHLLYPEEYDEPQKDISLSATKVPDENSSNDNTVSPEQLYLQGNFKDTELVIGIVNAVGTEHKRVLDPGLPQLPVCR